MIMFMYCCYCWRQAVCSHWRDLRGILRTATGAGKRYPFGYRCYVCLSPVSFSSWRTDEVGFHTRWGQKTLLFCVAFLGNTASLSSSWGGGGVVALDRKRRGLNLTIHFHLVQKSRMYRAIFTLLSTSSAEGLRTRRALQILLTCLSLRYHFLNSYFFLSSLNFQFILFNYFALFSIVFVPPFCCFFLPFLPSYFL